MKTKNILFALILFFSPLLKRGVGGEVFSQTPGEWTWMNGDNTLNSTGVFGTQGVASPTNRPPALYEPCEWKDNQGNFWLFGGNNVAGGSNDYAALWKFDPNPASPTYNQWTWMKGPSAPNQFGIYGTQGIPSASNYPGSRAWGATTWTDLSGNLWLFGGVGFAGGSGGWLNDLWKYDPLTNMWTWMGGSNMTGHPGMSGSIGVSSPSNLPSSRSETSCSWTDNSGNLWLYGGSSTTTIPNDLWKYDVFTNEWTWMHGANAANPAVYGVQGVAAPSNTPGGRNVYTFWTDLNNNLWLFGGYGGTASSYGCMNDLWKYDIAINQWTWVKGTNTFNDPGVYGTKCTSMNSNLPPAKYESRARVRDACGNFWMFGGGLPNSTGTLMTFNDLWHYNVSANQWTWVSGDNIPNQLAVYGIQGISNPGNKPADRFGGVSWIDNNGYIWVFGGGSILGYGNDLFRYVPDPFCTPVSAVVTASGNTTICAGQGTILTASGGTSYSWSPGGQSSSSIVVNPTASTSYTVTGSGACGSDTSSVTVTVIPNITAAAGPNTTICAGQSATLTASGGGNYSWSTAETTSSITISPTANTIYSVTVFIGTCSVTAGATVVVNPSPVAAVSNNLTIAGGNSTTLSASGGGTYTWSPSTGLSCSTCANPIASPSQTTTYCVLVTNTNGCQDSACVTVDIFPPIDQPCETIYIPNAFSPNNDLENDLECVFGSCIEKFYLIIYNRWGEKVFESSDQKICWDGTYKGKPLNTAVFDYYLQATLANGEEVNKKGNVSLIQ